MVLSFLLFVIVPTLVAGWYYAFVASDIYVSETKFAVRGEVEKLPGHAEGNILSKLTSLNSNQDAFIVASYIQSTSLLDELDKHDAVRSIYTSPGIDVVSRLAADPSAERLRKYWNKMVHVEVDNLSGVVTLDVEAFTPKDALDTSKAIVSASEKLVNEISVRRREDAVSFATDEMGRAEARLKAARTAVQQFRDRAGVLDPVKSAEADMKLGMQLLANKIDIQNELGTTSGLLSKSAPSVQVLTARLASLNGQIRELNKRLTDTDSADARTASRALSEFENVELEQQFATKLYEITQTALQTAKLNAARQQIYLVTFVQPALAEEPTLPRRTGSVMVAFVVCAVLWSIAALLTAAVKDHNT